MLEPLSTLKGHTEDRVWHVCWSKNGQFLASCGEDKVIRMWEFLPSSCEANCIATLEDAQERTLRCCEFSPDDKLIASASFDGTIVVWEARNDTFRNWDQIASLEGHDNEVKSVAWSHNGVWLATCGRDKKVWIWERTLDGEFECVSVLEGHTQDVKFVIWHPFQTTLFSCSYDDTIKVWGEDNDDWYCIETLVGHESTVWGLAISHAHRGNQIISCSDDKSIMLWGNLSSSPNGKLAALTTLNNVHDCPIYSVDWSPVHRRIATAGGDNAISICKTVDSPDGSFVILEHVSNEAHSNDINCLRWNPSRAFGDILVSAGDDGNVKLWKLMAPSEIALK